MATDIGVRSSPTNTDFPISKAQQDALAKAQRIEVMAESKPKQEPTALEKLQTRIYKRMQESLLKDATSEETLVGSINRYFILKASLIATHKLVKYMPNESIALAETTTVDSPLNSAYPKIKSKVDKIYPKDPISINQEYHVLLNLEKTALLKSELDMVGGENQMPKSVMDWQQTELDLSAIEECLEAIKSPNDNAIKYGGTTMLINMGTMMLYTPSALSAEDVDIQIALVDKHINTLYGISRALANAPTAEDAEIDALLEKYASLNLNDYIDNILSGGIFGMDTAGPHTAALASGAAVALAALDACRIKIKWLRVDNKFGPAIDEFTDKIAKLIAAITSRIDYTVRTAAAVAMKIATAALGVSDGVISAVLSLKMQLQELQNQYKEFVLGVMELGAIPTPPETDMAPCAIEPMMMADIVKAQAEAAIKNAALMPVMAIADVIMKPIFEAITDLTSEIQSYQDMLGSSLSSAFNLVSIDRWVMYVLCFQIKQLKDNINAQLEHYQNLRATMIAIKSKIPPKDNRYALLERYINASLVLLKNAAKKHDEYMDNNKLIYDELHKARGIVLSMYGMLSGRAPSQADKSNFIEAMGTMQEMQDNKKKYMDNIISAWDNLGALYREMVDNLVNNKMIEQLAVSQIELFRAYVPIPKTIIGLDISIDIDELEALLHEYLFPPPPPPPSVQDMVAPPTAPQIT